MKDQNTTDAALTADEIERVKKLQMLMAGLQSLLGDNWLFSMLQALLGGLTGYDPDQEGVDAARSAEEEQAGERDYEGRRASEERDYDKYKEPQRFIPQSIDDLAPLKAMKEKYGDGLKAIFPVEGNFRISSDFGDRTHPKTGEKHKHHAGLDIAPIPAGTNPGILAPMPGMITEIRYRGGYGLTMDMIDIYGVKHRFAHLSAVPDEFIEKMKRKEPVIVEPGDKIATMGSTGRSTGEHLHYEQMDAGNRKRAPEIAGKKWHEGEDVSKVHSAQVHGNDDKQEKPVTLALKPSVQEAAVAAVSFKVPVSLRASDGVKTAEAPPAPSGVFTYASNAFANAKSMVGNWLT